jgi:hypothetical protein
MAPWAGRHARTYHDAPFTLSLQVSNNRISSDTGRFAKAKFEPDFEAKEFSTSPQ